MVKPGNLVSQRAHVLRAVAYADRHHALAAEVGVGSAVEDDGRGHVARPVVRWNPLPWLRDSEEPPQSKRKGAEARIYDRRETWLRSFMADPWALVLTLIPAR